MFGNVQPVNTSTTPDAPEESATSAVLRTMLESARIVPIAYDKYRPLIVDGLVAFLTRLPQDRLAAITDEQLGMVAELDSDERVVALLRRCPTLHKLGQVVGHDKGLPAEIRISLQTLETMPPTADFAAVETLIRSQLGDAPGVTLAGSALAEGSVAVVVPFAWDGAPDGEPDRGVLKVVKPGVREQLAEELAIWPELATYLEERADHYGLPALDFRETLAGVRALLLDEIRLDLEQERLVRAGRFFAENNDVVVPRLLSLSTPLMTAMEFVPGRKITESGLPAAERKRLARVAIEALLAAPFWSTSPDAHFHADPHAGNLFVTDDGRVAIFDWALTTELTLGQRAAVVHALLGAATLDERTICGAIGELGRVSDPGAVRDAVRAGLRRIRRGTFPGFDWFTGILDELARTAAIHFPEETTLFRKSLLTMQGVAEDVSGEVAVDDVLVKTGIATFAKEISKRPLAPTMSREFGSHVSNLDLINAWMAVPWLPTRYWISTLRDLAARRGTPA